MSYKDVLDAEIKNEIDTDYGILRAYWKTTKRLIEMRVPRQEALKFLQHFGRSFGEFKMVEAKGDFIDAGIL